MRTSLNKTESDNHSSTNPFSLRRASHIPREVHTAYISWLLAIGAALFEMVVAVTKMLIEGSGSIMGMLTNIGLRVVIYGALVWVMICMHQGKNWARIILAIGLGVIGTLSLVIDPIR